MKCCANWKTDKVSVEVSAPTSGILSEILKPEGTTVDANAKTGSYSTGQVELIH